MTATEKKTVYFLTLHGDSDTGEMPTALQAYSVSSSKSGGESDFATAVRHARTHPVLLVEYEEGNENEVKVVKWHGPLDIQYLAWARTPLAPLEKLIGLLQNVCPVVVKAYNDDDLESLGVMK